MNRQEHLRRQLAHENIIKLLSMAQKNDDELIDFLEEKIEKLEAENIFLNKRNDWLCALEQAGVDNWQGIEMAHELGLKV